MNNKGCRNIPFFNPLRVTLLVCMFLAPTASQAVLIESILDVASGLQYTDSGGAPELSGERYNAGVLAASSYGNALTGIFTTYAQTTAELISDPVYGDYVQGSSATGQATMSDFVLTLGDSYGGFEIAPGQIGMNFNASYDRDAQNANWATQEFLLELTAVQRDASFAVKGSSRARFIHDVNFSDGVAPTETLRDLSGSSGILTDGIYEEDSRSVDGISGRLLLPEINLDPGDMLFLTVFMSADARLKADEDIPLADWPWASVDSTHTARLFAALDPHPGLSINIDGPVEWIDTGGQSVVPVPAAVWLFGTALIGFVGYGRRRIPG